MCNVFLAQKSQSAPNSKCTCVKARMGAKIHLTKRISQGLLMYSLLASAAAASLDEDIQAGETYIELQPGTHAFSGANVSGSLTIVGASAGDTTVECSGAFAVTGTLALHNLTITGCKNCQLDAAIRSIFRSRVSWKCPCAPILSFLRRHGFFVAPRRQHYKRGH